MTLVFAVFYSVLYLHDDDNDDDCDGGDVYVDCKMHDQRVKILSMSFGMVISVWDGLWFL